MTTNNLRFISQKKYNYHLLCAKKYFDSIAAVVNDLDVLLDNKNNVFYKNTAGDATTIAVVSIDGHKFVVKRYNIRGFWHFLKNIFRKSYAHKAWFNIKVLKGLNIPTLTPVALIEKYIGPFKGKSYLITEYIENGIRGCDYFAEGEEAKPEWEQIVKNIADIAAKLKQAFIEHRDFQYGNILIVGSTPILHDLEHMKYYQNNSPKFQKAFQKDIDHFLDFVKSNPTAHTMFIEAFKK